MKLDPLVPAQLLRVLADRLRQMPGDVAGPAGVILLRHRRAEQGHDPVPRELVLRPPELPHPFGQDGHEPAHDGRPHLGVEALLQIHRPGQVGEQDGDVLAFAGNGTRRRCGWSGRRDRCSAFGVEGFVVSNGSSALRARRRKRAAAGAAEPGARAVLMAAGGTRHRFSPWEPSCGWAANESGPRVRAGRPSTARRRRGRCRHS
jgi:hypothetical protein